MCFERFLCHVAAALVAVGIANGLLPGAEVGGAPVYSVAEITFQGPLQTAKDSPARDVHLEVAFRHESGSPEYSVQGFFDGDGQGGIEGDVFKVRFCPTRTGKWTLSQVTSNAQQLASQRRGDHVTATPSKLHGFWLVDDESAGRRWYKRSDGSHQFIFGNTHYTFLTEHGLHGKPTGGNIAQDMATNGQYFKKVRFGVQGGRYAHPTERPWLDDSGRPTDDGNYSHRPNPRWFHQRVDLAVQSAFEYDLIADMIITGPDTPESRTTLKAKHNGGDATPYLRYLAARYGSFPNVWICLCNEYDIKNPKYTQAEIAKLGITILKFLPYPTPLSVHDGSKLGWSEKFDTLPPWADHQIIQRKLRSLAPAADVIDTVWRGEDGQGPRRKPTINDELSYEGAGDKHTEADTIAAHLGAFLGGGYGTTGEKHGQKLGQYFWGSFDPAQHTAADNLGWLRETIDRAIQATYIRKVVDTVTDLDNVLYEVINEGGEKEWDWWVVELVREHERGKLKQHPIGITGHGAERLASMLASPADWISPGRNDGFAENPPAWDSKKVSLLDTDHVWGVGGNQAWVWKSFLRGHNPLFMDPYDGAVLGKPFDPQWEPIRRSMGFARRLAERVDLAAMTPQNLLSSTQYCLANVGSEYLIYVPAGDKASVDLNKAKRKFAVEWLDCTTGNSRMAEALDGGAVSEFTSPFAEDAVLHLFSTS